MEPPGDNNDQLDMGFLFVLVFLTKSSGLRSRYEIMPVHTSYSGLSPKKFVCSGGLCWTKGKLQRLNSKTSHFENTVVDITAKHCSTRLFILEYTFLYQCAKGIQRFGTPAFTEASSFENYNVHNEASSI